MTDHEAVERSRNKLVIPFLFSRCNSGIRLRSRLTSQSWHSGTRPLGGHWVFIDQMRDPYLQTTIFGSQTITAFLHPHNCSLVSLLLSVVCLPPGISLRFTWWRIAAIHAHRWLVGPSSMRAIEMRTWLAHWREISALCMRGHAMPEAGSSLA